MIIAAVFLLGIAATFIGAAVYVHEASARLEAAADRLETLAAWQRADPVPAPEPRRGTPSSIGPLTLDTMEPEDARVIKQRNRRGYFS